MPSSLDPILAPEQLASLSDVVLCDVRAGRGVEQAYTAGHRAGALAVNLERDLSAPVVDAARGGRHPLPDIAQFAARLASWGIGPHSHVVAYDDQGGANAAARLWWLLRAFGHTRVQVLDGGLDGARRAGLPLTRELPQVQPAPPYPAPSAWLLPTADLLDVDLARRLPAQLVLDVRAEARYLGEDEPIDPIAGHIPGAQNLPFGENLEADARFKTGEALRARYERLLGGRDPAQLIVHCGSGVTACHTLIALERAGLCGARLYVGSWSEWCRNPELPRAP
jgi:thiosulfate/3-mercaptopyruvate sulfurtransferase